MHSVRPAAIADVNASRGQYDGVSPGGPRARRPRTAVGMHAAIGGIIGILDRFEQ
jgi:hypothetical protein